MKKPLEIGGNGVFVYPSITIFEDESDKKLDKLQVCKKRKIMINKNSRINKHWHPFILSAGQLVMIVQ